MSIEKKPKKGGARQLKGHGTAKSPKPTKSTMGKKEKVLRGIYIGVTILATLVVIGFLIGKALFQKPELPTPNVDRPGIGIDKVDTNPTETKAPVTSTDRKTEDFYTFLVAGRDTGGGGNTDVVMLVSYDVTNQSLAVMNIPRDTMVNINTDIKKINAVYNIAGKGEEGIAALKDMVGQTTGVYPDYHVVVEWDAVGRLGRAIDGVDFEVPINMYYDDPYQDLHISVRKGMQHLNGDQIMQVLRFRGNNDGSGYPNGDIGRITTQQNLLKAIAGKLLQPATVTKIPDLVDIFAENVETDLSIQNLLWLAKSAIEGGLNVDHVTFVTMPGDYMGYAWSRAAQNNQSYVFPYGDEILELVNAQFNPYAEDLELDDLKLMYKNKDGTIAWTGGAVLDTAANPAWIAAKNAPKPTPTPETSDDPEDGGDVDEGVEPSPEPSTRPSTSPTPTPSTSPDDGGDQETSEPSTQPEESTSPQPSDEPEPSDAPQVEPSADPEPTPEPTPEPEPTPATTPSGPPEGIPT